MASPIRPSHQLHQPSQKSATLRGWLPLIMLPAVVLLFFPTAWPRWVFMWTLAVAIFIGCKWLTWRRSSIANVPWWRHVGYLCFWPGLDAKTFLRSSTPTERLRPSTREWILAALKCAVGALLFWVVPRLAAPNQPLLFGWIGMVGIILMLHFGSFHLLSCAWRFIGVQARPLMLRPLAASNLGEFWGRRWNTAFRDLTHRFLFKPLSSNIGARWALFVGFVMSGFIHELVISVPAGGGYGFPTLFFVVQAGAMQVERSRFGKAHGLGRGWRGWAWTMFALVVPAYGLFHPPFVRNIILPFMAAVGAGV